jgi:hypothetical protein
MIQAAGFVSFQYTLIPLTEQATETPAIPFSFFEPGRKAYSDLTIPAVPIQVNPGTIAADLKSLLQPSTQPGEPELTLSGLTMSEGKRVRSLTPAQQQPWFPLVQVSPALAFIALCSWDRRRRYLQQHPDILLRRRARRALRRQRREMRRASRAGDAIRFAGAAVGAMQVACAPHYPAEPRALVGSDVLPLLDDARADQKEIVRRVFASSDASHFSGRTGDAAGLLGLELQLEGVLELLEAKL